MRRVYKAGDGNRGRSRRTGDAARIVIIVVVSVARVQI